MKRLILFIALGIATTAIQPALAQRRNIIWVHGINSNANAWDASARFYNTNRQITSSNQTYVSLTGVGNMATTVRDRTIPFAGNRTIGIGHSMGGLTIREIHAQTAPGHVGGIITVGSPLNGAQIINSFQDGQVRGYVSHGVDELLKGPKRQFIIGYVIVSRGLKHFTGRDLGEIVEGIAMDNMPLDLLVGPSPNDMRVGSGYMNAARNYNVRVPNISINGSEQSPVHYRLASTSLGNPEQEMPQIIRDARAVYNTFYIANAATFFTVINAFRAAGWKAGRDFIDNESEKGWNALTGAVRTESRRSCYNVWVCGDDYSCYDNIVTYEDYLACEAQCYQEQCRTITQHYNQSSDAILHLSTQLGQRTNATTSNWNPDVTFEAVGANHSEYDEHAGTRQHFNTIFDAGGGAPVFFRTP